MSPLTPSGFGIYFHKMCRKISKYFSHMQVNMKNLTKLFAYLHFLL